MAANAFQPFRSPEINVALGKTDHPAGSRATGLEFLSYIQRAEPDFNAMEVNLLIANMVRVGLLMEMGSAGQGALGYAYMTVGMWTAGQAGGDLWLSELLGPALIVPSYGSATIAITGVTPQGDRDVGSGLVLDSAHIVTNKHVVEDMDVDAVLKKPLIRSPRATQTASDPYVKVDAPIDVKRLGASAYRCRRRCRRVVVRVRCGRWRWARRRSGWPPR